jgi:hypothetical protein
MRSIVSGVRSQRAAKSAGLKPRVRRRAERKVKRVNTYVLIYVLYHPPANRQPPKLANADDIRPQFQVSDSLTTDQTGAFSSSLQDLPQFLGCRFWNVGFILQGGAKVAHRSAVGPRKVTRNHY